MNNKPIVPVFKAEIINGGGEWKSETISFGSIKRKRYDLFMEVQPDKWKGVEKESLQISLDNGENWYSMERVNELIELGLQCEYAIEQLSPKAPNEQ